MAKTDRQIIDQGIPELPRVPKDDLADACRKTLVRLKKRGALAKVLVFTDSGEKKATNLARYLQLVKEADAWDSEVVYIADHCTWHLTSSLIAQCLDACNTHPQQELFFEQLAKNANRQNKPSPVRKAKYLERRDIIVLGLREAGCHMRLANRISQLLPL